MKFDSRGDSLAGYAGVTSVEVTEDGVVIKGEPDGVKYSLADAARIGAFLQGGDAQLHDHDWQVSEAAEAEAKSKAAQELIEEARKAPVEKQATPKKPTIPKKKATSK